MFTCRFCGYRTSWGFDDLGGSRDPRNVVRDGAMKNRNFTLVDGGLRIERVSPEVGEAVKTAVVAFRHLHQIRTASWQVRVYGLPDGLSMDVWIGRSPRVGCAHPYTIFHSVEAARQIMILLEGLIDPS